MAWSTGVISSNVREIGWTDEDGTPAMTVTWNSGRVSAYIGVDEETAVAVSKAPSVGQMINVEVKPYFAHRYA